MLKVLYLINFAGKAGTEKYVYNLIEKYHGSSAECFMVYNIEGPLCDRIRELGIMPKRIEMKNPFDIKAAKELAAYCRENEIDVIHAQYPRENYIALLARHYYKKIRVIYTSHLTVRNNAVWKLMNRLMTPKNHKVIAVCNYGKEVLVANGIPKDKIEVIFNGVSPAEVKQPSAEFKRSLGVEDDCFVISILARYEALKGLDFLIEGIARLKELTDKKFALLIAGDGELYDEIGELIKAKKLEGIVLQLGFRSDSAAILAVSDLYINSSQHEALSFAMTEALLHGLPIVATNRGGNPDIVSPENNCGALVEYGDSEALAKAMCEYIEDNEKLERESKNARKAAEELFNLDKLLDYTLKMYN